MKSTYAWLVSLKSYRVLVSSIVILHFRTTCLEFRHRLLTDCEIFKIRVRLTDVDDTLKLLSGKERATNGRERNTLEGTREWDGCEKTMGMRRVKELEPDRLMAHRFGTRSKVRDFNAREAMEDGGVGECRRWKALRQIREIEKGFYNHRPSTRWVVSFEWRFSSLM